MLSFQDALEHLLRLARPVGGERVAIDRAQGRVLAERIVAPYDAPLYDQSTMDGYAVRSSDCVQNTRLPIQPAESRAGGPLPPALLAKHAMRIFTGAPMPQGADAVVMQEEVTISDGHVSFERAPTQGRFVRPRGQDLRAGDVALEEGTRLSAAQCALACSLDRAWVRVARRPVVTILATGDELRDPASAGSATSIPDSNGVALAAIAEHAGAIARIAPHVGDDRHKTREAVRRALVGTDVLVTVGGASVGDHDHVRPALEAEGVTIDFWKVAIKPGKPLALGRSGETIVLGVPGNPASAMITFALFGVPLLRAMQRDARVLPERRRARLIAPLLREAGRLEFYRATVDQGIVRLLENQASGAVVAMARANALCVVPAETTHLDKDAEVDVIPFSELGL